MIQTPDDENNAEITPHLQSTFGGGGNGGRYVVATGLYDGDCIDPTVLTKDPPFWFPIISSRAKQHFYDRFKVMPKQRALAVLRETGIPPLCVLTLGIRWQLLTRDDFDYLDLLRVFEAAGHDVMSFGKTLDRLESRSLYFLYRTFGVKSAAMLEHADLSEFLDEDEAH